MRKPPAVARGLTGLRVSAGTPQYIQPVGLETQDDCHVRSVRQ
jgi:hypothetical protein